MASPPSHDPAPERRGVSGTSRASRPLDALGEYCYPVYERFLADNEEFVTRVETKLGEALRDTTVEMFLSRALALGFVIGGLGMVAGLTLGYVVITVFITGVPVIWGLSLPSWLAPVVQASKQPAIVAGSGALLGAFGFAIGFGVPLVELYHESYEREREIERLLPDAVAYMYALSVGGMSHLEIISSVAESEEVYGEVAREFQTIVQETTYFDADYRTAIHRRSTETPSESLEQFFTDMLSIISSGGDMTNFFDEKADRHLEIAKEQQEETLDTLELLGEMYLSISLFPLLLIILLVVMSLVGQGSRLLLYLTVYGIIPLIGVTFLVLISTVKQDDSTDGHLTWRDESPAESGRNDGGITVEGDRQRYPIVEQMERREFRHQVVQNATRPHQFFVERPLATLLVTTPLTAAFLAWAYLAGVAPTSFEGLTTNPVAGTAVYVYVPAFLTLGPLSLFHEWHVRDKGAVTENLSETLRKLSSANDTGLTLLESFRTVAEMSAGRLTTEFERIYTEVTYGTRLKQSLIQFNNRYQIPRLARVVKLIAEAQETSSQITAVLTTAARTSENQDEIIRNRKRRSQMQIAIIVMSFLTLLAVMAILKIQFLEGIASVVSGTAESGGRMAGLPVASNVDVGLLSLLFFHAVTIQAAAAGLISGYLRSSSLLAGIKYTVALLAVALVVWTLVGT